jgi:hypothetical protein
VERTGCSLCPHTASVRYGSHGVDRLTTNPPCLTQPVGGAPCLFFVAAFRPQRGTFYLWKHPGGHQAELVHRGAGRDPATCEHVRRAAVLPPSEPATPSSAQMVPKSRKGGEAGSEKSGHPGWLPSSVTPQSK